MIRTMVTAHGSRIARYSIRTRAAVSGSRMPVSIRHSTMNILIIHMIRTAREVSISSTRHSRRRHTAKQLLR